MSLWGDLFSHIPMRELAGYLTTYNMGTQVVAVDGTNVYNIQTTGGAQAVLNGDYINALAADAELLITDTEVTAQWAGNTAYSVDDEVVVGAPNGEMFKCLVAHTSVHTPKQGDGFWQALPNLAGYELADDFRLLIMVTVEADGTLGVWVASDAIAIGSAPVPKIPVFDPSVYCVVGFIDYANDAASATVTFGDTGGGSDFGTDGTVVQVLGPIFPDSSLMVKN